MIIKTEVDTQDITDFEFNTAKYAEIYEDSHEPQPTGILDSRGRMLCRLPIKVGFKLKHQD